MNGQTVYLNKFSKGAGTTDFPVELNNVRPGIYIMKIFNGNSFDTERLVIK